MLEVLYILILAGLSLFGIHRLFLLCAVGTPIQKSIQSSSNESVSIPSEPNWKITIQLPIYNEKAVAKRLIDAVCRLEYPPELFEVQVLDDSTDETSEFIDKAVSAWRSLGTSITTIRRTNRIGYKAGALDNGLKIATGDFIVIFDADFIPQPSFLKDALQHFTSENIGMIQARWAHHNRHDSLLTEVQAILLDGHFRIEQRARTNLNVWFNFNGTAGIWRRACIEDAGGWAYETLTEDLDLSYRAQMRGWRFKYVDELSVPAELPTDLAAFRSQQFRWAKGSIQVALKLLPSILVGPYSLREKIESVCHLLANLNYLLIAGLCVFLPLLILQSDVQATASWLGFFLFSSGCVSFGLFYLGSQQQHQPLRRTLVLLPFVFAIGLSLCLNNSRAVCEAILGRQSPFVRTPKTGSIDEMIRQIPVYRLPKSTLGYTIDLSLTCFFALLFIHCLTEGFWFYLPLLFLLSVGFSSVFWHRFTFGVFESKKLGTVR